MIISNWPSAIAHIDADCFYASCELLRRPELKKRPLCVLSSQDACIVAKTYDAKAAGITTGMAVWEAKQRLPKAAYLPADFRFYGQISRKMFTILHRFAPTIEHYSIDEGFVDLMGLCSLWRTGYAGIAEAIREAVREEIGITISVGVSVSRTLAKMASEADKPDGLTVVPGRAITPFLARLPVRDIPGIGANRTALLHKFGIITALDYARAPESLVQRLIGRGGVDLWRELNGHNLFGVATSPRLPKSMARTASLGMRTTDHARIRAQLSRHVFRLGMEMVAQGLTARRFAVVLRLGDFNRIHHQLCMERPTHNLLAMQRAASEALERLLSEGLEVSGCGIIATEIGRAGSGQGELFAPDDDSRLLPLWRQVHAARRRFGHGAIRPARTLQHAEKAAPRFRYPLLRTA